MNKDCIFCKIIKKELSSNVIYEDNEVLAFLDISQFTHGHTLVIPKVHVQFIWDIIEFDRFMRVVKMIGQHYRSLGFKYVDTLTFGRMVPHAHIHLVPHNCDNENWHQALKGLEYFHSDNHTKPSKEELNKIAEKFKL